MIFDSHPILLPPPDLAGRFYYWLLSLGLGLGLGLDGERLLCTVLLVYYCLLDLVGVMDLDVVCVGSC